MKRSLILPSAVALALVIGGCASGPKKDETASAATKTDKPSRPWWQLPKSWTKKPGFTVWKYGDVRPGKGLLSDDKDGFVVYQEHDRGSADPSKPEKVKR
jgi:hypothetical protein